MKNKLKELLSKKKMSVGELSKELGIGTTSLYQIVGERSNPSVKHAMKIAKYFNITVEELFLNE